MFKANLQACSVHMERNQDAIHLVLQSCHGTDDDEEEEAEGMEGEDAAAALQVCVTFFTSCVFATVCRVLDRTVVLQQLHCFFTSCVFATVCRVLDRTVLLQQLHCCFHC